jgi:hypothetical protein
LRPQWFLLRAACQHGCVTTVRPPESLADIVDIARHGATHQRTIAFGPIPLVVATESEHQLDDLAAHLAPSEYPGWRPLQVATVTADTLPIDHLPPELRPINDDEICTMRDGKLIAIAAGAERALWVLDPDRSVAVRWVSEYGDLSPWETISPLRTAGRWWATEHGASMVHAGAVGDDRGAVLLVGDGGAGKSTTTMACLGSGLEVLGDDYCFVEPPGLCDGVDDDVVVHATYRLAKLDDNSLRLLPHLRQRVVGTGLRGKSLIQLNELARAQRPVRALCHVVQRHGQPTEVESMSRIEALRAVAPSTMFQVRLFERETWEGLAAAVRTLPCFRLLVGDLGEVPDVLSNLIDRVARDARDARDAR